MGKIFISYRREDSIDATGRLHDRLATHFGRDNVFIDVDTIPFGVDFRTYLEEAVGRCDVLLAIIGEMWLSVAFKEPGMGRRLDDPRDFVRIEIESALKRGVPVVPVLVGQATMPAEPALPEGLRPLAFRNAAEVRSGRDFHTHVDRLIRGVEFLFTTGTTQPQPSPASPTEAPASPEPTHLDDRPSSTDQQPTEFPQSTPTPTTPGDPVESAEPSEPVGDDEGEATGAGEGGVIVVVAAIVGAVIVGVTGWFVGFGLVGTLIGTIVGWLMTAAGAWLWRRATRPAAEVAKEHVRRGLELVKKKRYEAALTAYRRAGSIDPDCASAYACLSRLLSLCPDPTVRNVPKAISLAIRACEMTGYRRAMPLRALAAAHVADESFPEALRASEKAVELDPQSAESHNGLAWLLATCVDQTIRDGNRAVQHATRACDLTSWESAQMLDTLAAACAESGRFTDAVRWQEKAIELGQECRRADYRGRLELYNQRLPYRGVKNG